MGGRGSSSRAKSFSVSQLNIYGTEKQVSWAQKIIQGAFDEIDVNISRAENRVTFAQQDQKRTYMKELSNWKNFKKHMTESYSRQAKEEKPISASKVIEHRGAYGPFGVARKFERWKTSKK